MSKRSSEAAAAASEENKKARSEATHAYVLIDTGFGECIESVNVFATYSAAVAAKAVKRWEAACEVWNRLRNRPRDKMSVAPVHFTPNKGHTMEGVLCQLHEKMSTAMRMSSGVGVHGDIVLTLDDYKNAIQGGFKFEELTSTIYVWETDNGGIGYPVPSGIDELNYHVRTLVCVDDARKYALEMIPAPFGDSIEKHCYASVDSEHTFEIYSRRIQH